MIVHDLECAGLHVMLKDGDRNLFVSPTSRITDALKARIQNNKQLIIQELKERNRFADLAIHSFRPPVLKPKHDLAVVTFAIGKKSERLARYTLPRIQQYAAACSADMVVVRDDQLPRWPIGNKLRFGDIAKHYERSLLIDIDIWINDRTPSIFDTHGPGVWMHPDVHYLKEKGRYFLENELRVIGKQQDRELIFRSTKFPAPTGYYTPPEFSPLFFNTGVILMDNKHAQAWQMPPEPLTLSHTAEQAWIDLMLSNQFHIQKLDSDWNWLWFGKSFMDRIHSVNFVHLANCSHTERLRLLRRTLSKGKRNAVLC